MELSLNIRTGIHARILFTKGRGSQCLGIIGHARNLVVNNGLNNIADTALSSLIPYCHVGIGNAPIYPSDNGLDSFFAATNNVISSADSVKGLPPYYARHLRTYRFVAGTFNDHQITEVAFSTQNTNGNVFSRALVVTPFDSPTAALIKSDEWLDVTYDFHLVPQFVDAAGNVTDGTGTITFGGSSYAYAIRPANVSNLTFWVASATRAQMFPISGDYVRSYGSTSVLGPVTGEPTAPSGAAATSSNSTFTYSTYSPGSYNRTLAMAFGPSALNASGGVGAIMMHTAMGSYQMRFTPAIPKNAASQWVLKMNLAWSNE